MIDDDMKGRIIKAAENAIKRSHEDADCIDRTEVETIVLEVLLKLLKEQEEQLSIKTENFNRLVAKVEVMPKIVRCENCENNIGGRCRNLDLWVETDPNWFCADGKRREGR